ncbi:MAG: carboxypeptidase-like regulatory domain-containing protein, partial [Myxococcota bacterium]
MVVWWLGSALAAPLSLAPQPPSPARLSVTVVDEVRPVEGLEVVVEGVVAGRTDDSGAAKLSVEPGRHFLQVLDGGLLVAELDLVTIADEVLAVRVVRERGEAARVDLAETSTHRGAVVGRVLDVDGGGPLANAKIRFGGRRVKTGRDGSYGIELPAGDYTLVVKPRRGDPQSIDHIRVVPDHRVVADVEVVRDNLQLRTYEVAGRYVIGEIARQIAEQREVTSVEDDWDAEQIAETRELTVARVLDRMPGITVEQGRQVLVRGQPAP